MRRLIDFFRLNQLDLLSLCSLIPVATLSWDVGDHYSLELIENS